MEVQTQRGDEATVEPAIRINDGTWRVDIDHYAPFIEEVTGTSVSDGISGEDCYRIGNRLQGLIEEMKGNGNWNPEAVASYPVVDSTEEVFWLSEFFRDCHSSEVYG